MFLARRVGGNIYGLAIDLGSSTLVLRLMDLENGEISDETSFHNPQIEIGADILTRIHFATRGGAFKTTGHFDWKTQ